MTNLEVLPGSEWAGEVAERLAAAVAAHPTMTLCLPTGATPRPVFHEVAARGLDLSRATVVQLDEFGGLPPGDPGRCDTMLRIDLFDRLAAPPARSLRLDPDAPDLEAECAALVRELVEPMDLVLLGIGANGHVALNEPGDPGLGIRRVELAESTAAGAVGYGAVRPPTWGLTLGIDAMLAAREVWLLVTGVHKAGILARALEGPVDASVPASRLREHPRLVVLADEDAAGALTRR